MVIFSDAESCWVFFFWFFLCNEDKQRARGGGEGNQHLEEFVPLTSRFNGIPLPKQNKNGAKRLIFFYILSEGSKEAL